MTEAKLMCKYEALSQQRKDWHLLHHGDNASHPQAAQGQKKHNLHRREEQCNTASLPAAIEAQAWGYTNRGGQGWWRILPAAYAGKESQLAYSIYSLRAKQHQGWIWKSSCRDGSAELCG